MLSELSQNGGLCVFCFCFRKSASLRLGPQLLEKDQVKSRLLCISNVIWN